jgi:hypothetical protein
MCGIQSRETTRGWAIFVGSSIRGHTRIAMGSSRVDLAKVKENGLRNLLQLHYKKGFQVAIKNKLKLMKVDITL